MGFGRDGEKRPRRSKPARFGGFWILRHRLANLPEMCRTQVAAKIIPPRVTRGGIQKLHFAEINILS